MGSNQYGQVGFKENIQEITKPTLLLKDENIFDICCGWDHSFILTSKKKKLKKKLKKKIGDEKGKTLLKGFGRNANGELGLNNNIQKVFGIQTISQFPNIQSLHCGANHSFILTSKKKEKKKLKKN